MIWVLSLEAGKQAREDLNQGSSAQDYYILDTFSRSWEGRFIQGENGTRETS